MYQIEKNSNGNELYKFGIDFNKSSLILILSLILMVFISLISIVSPIEGLFPSYLLNDSSVERTIGATLIFIGSQNILFQINFQKNPYIIGIKDVRNSYNKLIGFVSVLAIFLGNCFIVRDIFLQLLYIYLTLILFIYSLVVSFIFDPTLPDFIPKLIEGLNSLPYQNFLNQDLINFVQNGTYFFGPLILFFGIISSMLLYKKIDGNFYCYLGSLRYYKEGKKIIGQKDSIDSIIKITCVALLVTYLFSLVFKEYAFAIQLLVIFSVIIHDILKIAHSNQFLKNIFKIIILLTFFSLILTTVQKILIKFGDFNEIFNVITDLTNTSDNLVFIFIYLIFGYLFLILLRLYLIKAEIKTIKGYPIEMFTIRYIFSSILPFKILKRFFLSVDKNGRIIEKGTIQTNRNAYTICLGIIFGIGYTLVFNDQYIASFLILFGFFLPSTLKFISCSIQTLSYPGVSKYFIRRLLGIIPSLIAISILLYSLLLFAGNPVDRIINSIPPASPDIDKSDIRRFLENYWGLDRQSYEQYLNFLFHFLIGDFGLSIFSYRNVQTEVGPKIIPTLELVIIPMILCFLFIQPLSKKSLKTKKHLKDQNTNKFPFIGLSTIHSSFIFLFFFVGVFSPILAILPSVGSHLIDGIKRFDRVHLFYIKIWRDIFGHPSENDVIFFLYDHIMHLIVPVSVLTIITVILYIRLKNSGITENLQSDYLAKMNLIQFETENAMNLKKRLILLPLLSYSVIIFGSLLSMSAIVEKMLVWPGLGQYAIRAALQLDYQPLIIATLLIFIIFYLGCILLDFLYVILDPSVISGESKIIKSQISYNVFLEKRQHINKKIKKRKADIKTQSWLEAH